MIGAADGEISFHLDRRDMGRKQRALPRLNTATFNARLFGWGQDAPEARRTTPLTKRLASASSHRRCGPGPKKVRVGALDVLSLTEGWGLQVPTSSSE